MMRTAQMMVHMDQASIMPEIMAARMPDWNSLSERFIGRWFLR